MMSPGPWQGWGVTLDVPFVNKHSTDPHSLHFPHPLHKETYLMRSESCARLPVYVCIYWCSLWFI